MKRALMLSLTAVLALPIFGSEPENARKKETTAKKSSAAREPEAQPEAAASVDSPLVAAAKRSARRGKTSRIVITDETLKAAAGKGHITTTSVTESIKLPPPAEPLRPTPEMIAAAKAAEERKAKEAELAAARKRDRERQRQLAVAAAADEDEDGLYQDFDDDPAAAEKRLRNAEQTREGSETERPPQR